MPTNPRDVRPVVCLHAHAEQYREPDERHDQRDDSVSFTNLGTNVPDQA